jgi:hypothetical protein
MRRSRLLLFSIGLLGCASETYAAVLRGSVFLYPIDGTSFRSSASATYHNDVGSIGGATLSGQHKVNQTNGSLVFETQVKGDATYSYDLEGPANPGQCFGTTLNVIADSPFLNADREDTWNGPEIKCAPNSVTTCTSCACNFSLCEQSEFCPLILDLNNDGIATTGLDAPVLYWFDLQGRPETTAWTNPSTEEAFIWIDLDLDRSAHPTELFGSRMSAPNGGYHRHGFEALVKYDTPDFGGDGDGRITSKDRVWPQLKLWVDRNHDAISQPGEISVPMAHGIVALNLAVYDAHAYDQQGNEIYLAGNYVMRVQGRTEERVMADIEFAFVPNG